MIKALLSAGCSALMSVGLTDSAACEDLRKTGTHLLLLPLFYKTMLHDSCVWFLSSLVLSFAASENQTLARLSGSRYSSDCLFFVFLFLEF